MQRILPVTYTLLIANVVCYVLQWLCGTIFHIDLTNWLGLHFVLADNFGVWQLVTYMFLHGGMWHLFMNMFSLYMFGSIVESNLGQKRFILLYMVCGIGAGICQELWQTAQYFIEGMYAYDMVNTGASLIPMSSFLDLWTTIGASGACYGILLAFGMLHPNERLMMLFPPIPMKAKYFVAVYIVIEAFSAFGTNDNVAHFAHLGGMLFCWFLFIYWRRHARQAQANPWQQWNARTARPSLLDRLKALFKRRPSSVGNAHHAPHRPETDYEYNERRRNEEARMDEILDKVRKSGYGSLTTEEKNELFRISHR